MTTTWFLVSVKGSAERRVADALELKGFDIYLPMATRVVRHARRPDVVARPLFPRYMFVALDERCPRFAEVRRTWGVHAFVNAAGTLSPLRVQAQIVGELRAAEEAGVFDDVARRVGTVLPKGTEVRITQGPFRDLIAEVVAAPTERRVEVLLKGIAGGRKRIVVPLAKLAPTG